MGIVRAIINANIKLSLWIDRFLPARLREDGNKAFVAEYLPKAAAKLNVVYEVGGGSRPFYSRDEKRALSLTIVGLDISGDELAAAPSGIYDRSVVADICTYSGEADADLVICQATLEHVADTAAAMRSLKTLLKPGGRLYIFAPSRKALFARINLLMPESLKRRILFAVFPSKAEGHDGFKAYYDHCTPLEIEALATANDLEVVERKFFWTSSYFTFFTPAFVAWRIWQGLAYMVSGNNAAESFIYVLRR